MNHLRKAFTVSALKKNNMTLGVALDTIEQMYILDAVMQFNTIKESAKQLGVSRTTLIMKMKKYDLQKKPKETLKCE